jgi:hypothetical protein
VRLRRALTRRSALRYAVATAVTVLAGLSVGAARPARVSFPAPAPGFGFEVVPGATALQIAVRSLRRGPVQLTIFLGDRQASFLHPGPGAATYRLAVPPGGTSRTVRIEADPPASVALAATSAGAAPRRPTLHWQAAGPPLELAPPRPATPDRPTAEASVDETDTYGLRLFGVPVRAAPAITAPLVTSVSHGDRLQATCWATGDPVTDGFPERPIGAYSSDVWFRVVTDAGAGFIPDVRFSRRGNSDRLDLPPCAGS